MKYFQRILVKKLHRYRMAIYISHLCSKPLKDYSSNKALTKRDETCLTVNSLFETRKAARAYCLRALQAFYQAFYTR